jgi:hypothetical protein
MLQKLLDRILDSIDLNSKVDIRHWHICFVALIAKISDPVCGVDDIDDSLFWESSKVLIIEIEVRVGDCDVDRR